MLEIFDVQELVRSSSYLLLTAIIFAESGLFFGFIFPGDSLLFLAGFAASQGFFNIIILTTLFFLAAILGDNVGYAFGKHTGKRIFRKKDSLFFHQDHLLRAEQYFEKHGGKTIIMARFIPVVRTFAPILAGVGRMNYKVFFLYNLIGGVIWAIGVTLSGYFLGKLVPNVDRYLVPIVVGILLTSFLPAISHFSRDKELRKKTWQRIKALFHKNT